MEEVSSGKMVAISQEQCDLYIKNTEDLAIIKDKVERLEEDKKEWERAYSDAMGIINFDQTLSQQSPYWRSMILSLVDGLSIDKEIINQHIEFEIAKGLGGEITNISMSPKTPRGMKLIQIWGVMDMLKELVESLKGRQEG